MPPITPESLICDECGKPAPHSATRHAIAGFVIEKAKCVGCLSKRSTATKKADKSSRGQAAKKKTRKRSSKP